MWKRSTNSISPSSSSSLPPPSSPPPPPPCLSVSLLSLHFIHFHNPSFPPESDDEGAGQAGNVFFFLFLLSASLFPPPSFPRSPKKPSVTRHLVKCKSDSFEGVALNQLSFLSVHVSVSSPPDVHEIAQFHSLFRLIFVPLKHHRAATACVKSIQY